MSNVYHIDFKARALNVPFSADIYSFDMKKYRFQVIAGSIQEAYYSFVFEASLHRVNVIRCIAIYFGLSDNRKQCQVPAKVWQQYDPLAGKLVEY